MSLNTALRQITRRVVHATGMDITLRRITPGTYSTSTGRQTPVQSDTIVKARVADYLDRELNDRIAAGDRKVIIAALDLSVLPTVKDQVLIGTKVYDIVRIQSDYGQDEPAVHTLQIRA